MEFAQAVRSLGLDICRVTLSIDIWRSVQLLKGVGCIVTTCCRVLEYKGQQNDHRSNDRGPIG